MTATTTTVSPDEYFPAELTTLVAVQIPSGARYTVRGIFNKEYLNLGLGEATIEDQEIVFTAPTTNLPGIVDRTRLTVTGTDYLVMDIQADAEGVTRLRLNKKL